MLVFATQNKFGDGVTISLMEIPTEEVDCKTVEAVGVFLAQMEKKYNVPFDDFDLMVSSSLNWPRDHPDCTDGCVALCNALTGNTVD